MLKINISLKYLVSNNKIPPFVLTEFGPEVKTCVFTAGPNGGPFFYSHAQELNYNANVKNQI